MVYVRHILRHSSENGSSEPAKHYFAEAATNLPSGRNTSFLACDFKESVRRTREWWKARKSHADHEFWRAALDDISEFLDAVCLLPSPSQPLRCCTRSFILPHKPYIMSTDILTSRKARPLSTVEGFALGGMAACVAVRHAIVASTRLFTGLLRALGYLFKYPRCCQDTHAAARRAGEGRRCQGVQECV